MRLRHIRVFEPNKRGSEAKVSRELCPSARLQKQSLKRPQEPFVLRTRENDSGALRGLAYPIPIQGQNVQSRGSQQAYGAEWPHGRLGHP